MSWEIILLKSAINKQISYLKNLKNQGGMIVSVEERDRDIERYRKLRKSLELQEDKDFLENIAAAIFEIDRTIKIALKTSRGEKISQNLMMSEWDSLETKDKQFWKLVVKQLMNQFILIPKSKIPSSMDSPVNLNHGSNYELDEPNKKGGG